MKRTTRGLITSLAAILIATVFVGCGKQADESSSQAVVEVKPLIVYSSRAEHLIQPVFELYTQQTGTPIEFITDKAGVLIERLKQEGDSSSADVFITVDAGNLGYAAAEGLLLPLDSSVLTANVPAHLRDEQNRWTGLSLRARTIVYSTERVTPDELSTYEALGDEAWDGLLCLRTAKKVYNQSLVAMLIAEHGEEKTQQTVEAWVNNLAVAPLSNDTKVMQSIMVGQCDVGIVNSYYFGRMKVENPELPLALFWPNQGANDTAQTGVHVNISGAGVLKHSKQAAAAQEFVEWMASDDAQAIFGGVNQEYPINPAIAVDPEVKSWGEFKASELPLSRAYELQPAAVKLMDRAGYH
ncbi:MAG: extracellular solute-binding protein [Pseudomonadales bacterium]